MAYKVGDLELNIALTGDDALSALSSQIGSLSKKAKNTSGSGKGGQSSLFSAAKLFNFNKILSFFRGSVQALQKIARYSAQVIQYGVDYTETLNIWQVAMKGNLSMAEEFVQKMNKAYGISTETLMNAQAIFKNMIGSLGQISENTAYNISESITQMAIDYASLYNVSIDSAITKFQAALAGQVRPIRSVSGYDITENTLYQLYQSLGGTKTMRQLSRTEKQLLSIYAIFEQMGSSGAIGDMTKTLDQFANQSRMLTENWKEIMTWIGVSLQYLLQEENVLQEINAALIFATEFAKSFAYSLGYVDPNFALSWADNVEETEEAVDNLTSKLLGFDKIRAMDSGESENILGIDQSLLEALSSYSSFIDQADNKARKLAESWMEVTFWTRNANGELEFNEESAANIKSFFQEIINTLKDLKPIFAELFENLINSGILTQILKTGSIFTKLIVKLLDTLLPIFADVIGGILPIINEVLNGLLMILDGVQVIVNAFGDLSDSFLVFFDIIRYFSKFWNLLLQGLNWVLNIVLTIVSPVIEFFSKAVNLVLQIFNTLWKAVSSIKDLIRGLLDGDMEKFLQILSDIVVPFLDAFTSFKKENWKTGESGDGGKKYRDLLTENAKNTSFFDNYANGGLPDKGTVFRAGEAGAEIVYNTPSGQSGVANVQQIAQAQKLALDSWWAKAKYDIPSFQGVSDNGIYTVVTNEAQRRGNHWAK